MRRVRLVTRQSDSSFLFIIEITLVKVNSLQYNEVVNTTYCIYR